MRSASITCGEATMQLLAEYGVDTVFGIPGVHTLDFFRSFPDLPIRHVQARNEQGAGFMADGYARASGRPGVALVISGPGVTNALTPIGQSWADSIPVLLLSSEPATHTLGKGWGMLHEIPDQRAVTEPLTALSLRAQSPDDVPEFVARAFDVFGSQRPRPVHISIPIDVLAMQVTEEWEPRSPGERPHPVARDIASATALLEKARRPVVMVGGGAVGAAKSLTALAESLDAPVVSSAAGKGIVPDDHPLSLNASVVRPEVQEFLATADVVLAVGTELAETDSFIDRLELNGAVIRVDIDPRKIDDQYEATVGIVSDAGPAVKALIDAGSFESDPLSRASRVDELDAIRHSIFENLTDSERRHVKLLEALGESLDDNTIIAGDICQVVYTGVFAMVRRRPRTWFYPAGYCTLGCGLPDAIGAAMALPERNVVALVGDGGFMFTVQELMVASEEGLGLPVVIWANDGLKQIRDDMNARSIPPVGVSGRNPDFVELARSMGCDGVVATSLDHVVREVEQGFAKDHPTVIVVEEESGWLDG